MSRRRRSHDRRKGRRRRASGTSPSRGKRAPLPDPPALAAPGRGGLLLLEGAAWALILIALLTFVPAPGPPWSSSLLVTLALAGSIVLYQSGRCSSLLPPVLGVAVAFLVDRSGALSSSLEIPGSSSRTIAPAVLAVLLLGAGWALVRAHGDALKSWNSALWLTGLGLTAWVAGTTLVVTTRRLVDPVFNAQQLGAWLLILLVLGGISAVAAEKRTAARRLAVGALLAFFVGLGRARF